MKYQLYEIQQQYFTQSRTLFHVLSDVDHYQGLSERWEAGPIFCSEITGALAVHILGISRCHINILPMDTPVDVQGTPKCSSLIQHDLSMIPMSAEVPCFKDQIEVNAHAFGGHARMLSIENFVLPVYVICF